MHHITSHHTAWHRITSHQVTSLRITSHTIPSHHVTSQLIPSRLIVLETVLVVKTVGHCKWCWFGSSTCCACKKPSQTISKPWKNLGAIEYSCSNIICAVSFLHEFCILLPVVPHKAVAQVWVELSNCLTAWLINWLTDWLINRLSH